MGNNFCYQSGGSSQCFPQLIQKQHLQGCDILLTAGNIENEDVECIVKPTDQEYSNIAAKNRPSFIPQFGQCIFVGGGKDSKHVILAVVLEKGGALVSSDKSDDEKQIIFSAIQTALKMAESKQFKSIAFPVFPQKDFTTSATIMLMAIKLNITEQKLTNLQRISVTLNVIEQLSSFKWVFQQVFKSGQIVMSPSKSYSSSIASIQGESITSEQKLVRQQSNHGYTP